MSAVIITDPIMITVLEHRQELGYAILATAYEYRVEFKCYEFVGPEQNFDGTAGGMLYKCDDLWVENIDEADVFLSGHVKWDGCSNWHFDAQDDVMLHFCSRKDLVDIGVLMAACWDRAAKLCPKWDQSLTGGS